jgi:diguanylate cyclase (GGDEF)-like protein
VHNTAARCLDEGRAVDLEAGVLLLRRDGAEVPIGDSAAPLRDRAGDTVGVVLVIQDESEKRRVGHRLSYEASHDALTGLVNRREFERRLAHLLDDPRTVVTSHVLLSLDLDGFKAVNDASGHDAGDDLLRSLGPLLARFLRQGDTLARIGGDEFGVLLEDCPIAEAARVAEQLRAAVEEYRFERIGRRFAIGLSIGMAQVSHGKGGIAATLRAADHACYVAKEMGGNRVERETTSSVASDRAHEPGRRLFRLTEALEQGQFRLYAQPIVSLQHPQPSRARLEILLRLPDQHGRMQVAADFLPQAARYNLMPAIDQWVVRETIARLGGWQRAHPGQPTPICAINLSASALADTALVPTVEKELARHGVAPDSLCFELAEQAAVANLSQTVRFLSGVRRIGCGMALEDFGGGITSLTYLRTLPVDFLKIGGQFIGEMAEDPMCGSIVSAVHQIGQSMGITTIAKQVSSEPVLEKLRAMGIGYAQGRAVKPPVPWLATDGTAGMSATGGLV